MTNKRVVETAEINEISRDRGAKKKAERLGQVLRREDVNDCFTALGRTPESRRTRGGPKTTWGRTVERERG